MIKWDKLFIQKCKVLGIKTFYSRFKDDIFISAASLENGTKLEDGHLVVDVKKKEKDEVKSYDNITMEVVRQVAEVVHPMIKFTIDIPSENEDEKIAVLDLKIKLNNRKIE